MLKATTRQTGNKKLHGLYFLTQSKTFLDFHDVYVSINFSAMCGFWLNRQYVCMYVCKQNKCILYSNLYNTIHFYAVYLKINFGLGLRDSKCCQDLRATWKALGTALPFCIRNSKIK